MEWRRKLNNCKLKAIRLDKGKYDASGAVQSDTTHSSFQVLQNKVSSLHETDNKDIREQCEDICYSEQQHESVKAGNTPLVGRHQEAYCSTLNKEECGTQSRTEIGKKKEMRKPRRRFVVLDDDSESEGEGGAIGGKFSSSFSARDFFPPNKSYSEPQFESANHLPAQPVSNPIWSGCFIFDRESNTSVNIWAHLSNKASEKASKAANGLPVKLYVKIMDKSDVWPKSFLRSPPTDNSIGLYLFPELERDEIFYDALLEDVIDNDLAMSALIDDLDLLIFSSRELPQKHWRIRRKYYFWGVFRPKPHSCPNIPTANFDAQTSSTQNVAPSNPPSKVEGANTGSPQGLSSQNHSNTLEGCTNSGNPQGQYFSSPLSSCCSHISNLKDSPCQPETRQNKMVHECCMSLDSKNQDIEQNGTCRIRASDIHVSAQQNAPGDDFGPCLETFQVKSCLSFATKV